MKSIRDPAGVRIEPLSVGDARSAAKTIVADAERAARALIHDAHREAEASVAAIVARAEREAHERVVARYAAAIATAERETRASERDIVALALDVARNVLGAEASSSPAVIEAIAKKSLARVRRARSVVLRVNVADVAMARARAREWLAPGAEPSVFEIVEDESVERGGVVVECELGRIDARIESQLAAIGRALEGA